MNALPLGCWSDRNLRCPCSSSISLATARGPTLINVPVIAFLQAPGQEVDQSWPLGDQTVWKTALAAQEDVSIQGLTNDIVHELTTTLARQPYNLVGDESAAYQGTVRTSLPFCVPADF